ncbi:hypothetical protein EI94DRAFT_1727319, partial [Lactarius quietus]
MKVQHYACLCSSCCHLGYPKPILGPTRLLGSASVDLWEGSAWVCKFGRLTDPVSSNATPTSVVESLRGSQFAHFECHGVLETEKPFDASFKLHGGSRLTLLDIARSQLPDAEFAFLSCCHPAEITNKSVAASPYGRHAVLQISKRSRDYVGGGYGRAKSGQELLQVVVPREDA